jgi:hypothetical protein
LGNEPVLWRGREVIPASRFCGVLEKKNWEWNWGMDGFWLLVFGCWLFLGFDCFEVLEMGGRL